jgi:hypothetical protein
VKRRGVMEKPINDTRIDNLPYMYEDLINWIMRQVKTQKNEMSLDNITELIKASDYPEKFLISIGSYSSVGKDYFLENRDEIFVVLYDNRKYTADSIKAYLLAFKTRNTSYDGMIILHQRTYL